MHEIKSISIGNARAQKQAVWKIFLETIRKKPYSALLLTLATGGYYLIGLWRKSKRTLKNGLAARKINYYPELLKRIETIREAHPINNPRRDINHLCNKLMAEKIEDDDLTLEYKQIFTSSDLFLFITTPPNEEENVPDHTELETHAPDYYRMWSLIKKQTRKGEFSYIQSINESYTILTKKYNLTADEINEKLKSTKVALERPTGLTKLKHLSRAFRELAEE